MPWWVCVPLLLGDSGSGFSLCTDGIICTWKTYNVLYRMCGYSIWVLLKRIFRFTSIYGVNKDMDYIIFNIRKEYPILGGSKSPGRSPGSTVCSTYLESLIKSTVIHNFVTFLHIRQSILAIPSAWNHTVPYLFRSTFLVTIAFPAFQNNTRLLFASLMMVINFSFENMSTVDWLSKSIHPFGIAASSWI